MSENSDTGQRIQRYVYTHRASDEANADFNAARDMLRFSFRDFAEVCRGAKKMFRAGDFTFMARPTKHEDGLFKGYEFEVYDADGVHLFTEIP
jgi:hypothetical protein